MRPFKGTFGGYKARVFDGIDCYELTTVDGIKGSGYDCMAVYHDDDTWTLVVNGLGCWDVIEAKNVTTA